MRNRLISTNNTAINKAVFNYFKIPQTKSNIADPDQKTLKSMRDVIELNLKEKFPKAQKTDIDDFIYILFREVVKYELEGELFPHISRKNRRPKLAILFAKNYAIKQILKEISNFWQYVGISGKRQEEKMTTATIEMLERTCFKDAIPYCDVTEEESAEMIKQLIKPGQVPKFANYAIETNDPALCHIIRNHFELPEGELDKLCAVLVANKLIEIR